MTILTKNSKILSIKSTILKRASNIVTIGDRIYKTVTIGNQIWLAENLDYQIPDIAFNPTYDTGERSAQMYYTRNSDYSLDGNYKFGMMYNGSAVAFNLVSLIPTLAQGWRVSTMSDWNTLITTIGGTNNISKLKATDNSILQAFPSGWNGTDEYGFNILPSGYGERRPGSAPTYNRLGEWIVFRLGSGSSYNTDSVEFSKSEYFVSKNRTYTTYGYVRLVKDA